MSSQVKNQIEQDNVDYTQLMIKRNTLMVTEPSLKYGREFIPQGSDVFICTYPKCGTTWVQQICHSLRSGGSLEFDEICEVVPWDILALDCKQNLDEDQSYFPRLFKSHEPFDLVAKNKELSAKYIHVARHPHDVFVSFYHFLPNYVGIEEGKISVEDFCEAIYAGASSAGQIWHFYMSYWKALNEIPDRVLWVFYEDLKKDRLREIKRIGRFMEVELSESLVNLCFEHSSFEFMLANKSKFDDHFVFGHCRERMGIPDYHSSERVGKVRKGGGKVGSRSALSESIIEKLDNKWRSNIETQIGFSSYEQLREAVKKKQRY